MRRNENGFGLLGSILLIVVIGLAGMTGWFLYERNDKKSSNDPPAETQTNLDSSASTESEVFDLHKMGVRLTFSEHSQNLAFLETTATDSSRQVAFFSLSAEHTPPECKLTEMGGMVGAVWKIPGKYPENPDENSGGSLVKQFPTHYLAFKKPAMSCTNDVSINAEITKAQQQLTDALANSTEIK